MGSIILETILILTTYNFGIFQKIHYKRLVTGSNMQIHLSYNKSGIKQIFISDKQ